MRPIVALAVFAPAGAFAASSDHVSDVAEAVVPAVVNISATRAASQGPYGVDPFYEFFGRRMPNTEKESSLGSGVIVDASGVILTNNHVVAGAEELKISLNDGRIFDGEVVGTDPETDIAVVRLTENVADLPMLKLGDSGDLRLGETVLAVGNPFGFNGTITMGIVSAVGRDDVGIVDYENFIQTDAAINPGNSGGALVNMKGELIGVNTAIISRTGGYQGIGFAIPSNLAGQVMKSLLQDGTVARAFLGVAMQPLTPELGEHFNVEQGVLISRVESGSPADRAGLRRGDVVVSVDGRLITSPGQLHSTIGLAEVGSRVTIDVVREGKARQVVARLGSREDVLAASAPAEPESEGVLKGLSVESWSQSLASRYNLDSSVRGGLVVTNVEPRSVAASIGLRPGDVIVEINRREVRNPSDLKNLGRDVLLLIRRGASQLYTRLRM